MRARLAEVISLVNRFLIAAAISLFSSLAFGQSNPGFRADNVLTAAQLNAAFGAKQDYPFNPPVVSVFGRSGAVSAQSNDYSFGQVSGQAALTQLPTLGANTVLGSIAGGTPIALTSSQLSTLLGLGTFATQNFATPPALGGTTPAAGSFSSLTNTGITGLTQCVQANSAGLLSGTGSACGSGGGGITALTGDVTASGSGSVAATLATVNSNVGSFGSSTSIPSLTVNGKGLVTAASGNAVIAPAGTLSGTALNPTVVSSSLTGVGTLTSGATGAGFTVAFGSSTFTGSVPPANLPLATTAAFGAVKCDGTTITCTAGVIAANSGATFANPTASIGLTAVNGSATTGMRSDGAPALSQAIAPTWTGQHIFSPARTIASATGAALDDVKVSAATTTITGTTTITALAKVGIYQPTITDASAVTVTDTSTLYIDNAPVAGGSVTLTNSWALRVGAGNVSFPGLGLSASGLGGSGTGNAQMLLTPTLGSTCGTIGCGLDDGLFVIPTVAASSTFNGQFYATYNMKWGDTGTPVPSGWKGVLSGYECNVTTAHLAADVIENDHCFGGTMASSGTAGISGIAITLAATNVAGPVTGVNIHVQGPSGNTALVGYSADSTGSAQPPSCAFCTTSNNWGLGFGMGDFAVSNNGGSIVVAADGYQSRTGLTGPFLPHYINLSWNGSSTQLYIDNSNTGTITVTSDARIKDDIQSIDGNSSLELVSKLKPVSFKWKEGYGESDRLQFGFTAQAMRDVIPSLVVNTGMETEATPDGMLRIDYSGGNIIALLVAALQQQQRDIAALSKRETRGKMEP